MRTALVVVILLAGAAFAVWRFPATRDVARDWFPSWFPAEAKPVATKAVPPTEVSLLQPVQIPAVINGRTAGTLTLNRGTMVKVVGDEGQTLRIWHMGSLARTPKSATDFDDRVRFVPIDSGAVVAKATPASSARPWHPGGTALDRAPFEVKNGKVSYSDNYDASKAGISTETDYQADKTKGKNGAPPSR